jgi:hypothetical protein
VAYAPNQTAATFRTGGLQYGTSTGGFTPLGLPTAAGTHIIRVFLNSTNPAVTGVILKEDTVTLAANQSYTYYLYGYMNSPTNGTPALTSLLAIDSAQTIAAGKYAVRVIHLAGTMAGTAGLATRAVDVWVDTLAAGAAPVGAPAYVNVDIGQVRAYTQPTARPTPALNYRVVFAATGTTTPIVAVLLPAGVVGNSTTNAIPGDLVVGTQITAVLVPRSVALTAAPQTAAFNSPTAVFMIDQLPLRTAP